MSDSISDANVLETKSSRSSLSSVKSRESALSLRLSDSVVAYTILRLSFGANILLHGLSRLLNGRPAFLAYLNHYFEHAHLISPGMLPAFATVLPWVETTLGLLLMLGLATRFSLIVGALVMTFLVFGTNLAQDWNVAGLQLIYCFIYYHLLVQRERNVLSLDAWWGVGAS